MSNVSVQHCVPVQRERKKFLLHVSEDKEAICDDVSQSTDFLTADTSHKTISTNLQCFQSFLVVAQGRCQLLFGLLMQFYSVFIFLVQRLNKRNKAHMTVYLFVLSVQKIFQWQHCGRRFCFTLCSALSTSCCVVRALHLSATLRSCAVTAFTCSSRVSRLSRVTVSTYHTCSH